MECVKANKIAVLLKRLHTFSVFILTHMCMMTMQHRLSPRGLVGFHLMQLYHILIIAQTLIFFGSS